MRREIPEGGTSNCYGDTERLEGLHDLEWHNTFARVMGEGVPKDEVRINGRFVYTRKHKPLKAGHVKTDAYIENRRRLDSRFARKAFEGK